MSEEEENDMIEQTSHSDDTEEVVEEHSSTQQKESSEVSLEKLEAELKRSKWSVFLFVGITVVMFGFALFLCPLAYPMMDYGVQLRKISALYGGRLPLEKI